MYESLFSAAVIAYSRPFIAIKQYPGIPAEFGKFENPGFQTFHDETIAFRNRFVAHCDARDIKVQILPKGIQFRSKDGSLYMVARHATSISTRWFHARGLSYFDELCAYQLERLGSEIDVRSKQLFAAGA